MADDGQTFPAGNAATELNRHMSDRFPSDSISSANNDKEAAKSRARAGAAGGKCRLGSGLKSALAISSVVVAAVLVAFFVTKKQKQT